jgi:hypothetical protein
MTGNTNRNRTIAELGQAVTDELNERYSLVDTYPGQEIPADVVAAIVRGGNLWETDGGERLTAWADEELHSGACRAVDELARDITGRWEREDGTDHSVLLDKWEVSTERDEAVHEVCDRDISPWYTELVNAHGKVLLRVGIAAMNEDAGLSFTPMSPQKFLDLLGFAHTPQNLVHAAEVVGNASPEHTVAIGYALLGVELSELDKLPADPEAVVELRDPHVWLGSPFAGSGWCSEESFTGTLTVRRGDLLTDADAFGWSWEKVVGGVKPSDFGGSLHLPTPTPEPLPLGTLVSSRSVQDVGVGVRELARARGWKPGETDAGSTDAALAWLDEHVAAAGCTIVRDDDGVHLRQAREGK